MSQQLQHLQEEQFADLLFGETTDTAAQAHLEVCEQCQHELDEVRSATAEFNAVSMAWSLVEAPRRVHTPSRFLLLLGGRPSWGIGLAVSATACLLALGMNLPMGHPHSAEVERAARTAPSTAEIAQDDRLLQSINNDLRYDPDTSFSLAALRSSHPRPHHAPARVSH